MSEEVTSNEPSFGRKLLSFAVNGLIAGAVVGAVAIVGAHALAVGGAYLASSAIAHSAVHTTLAAAATHIAGWMTGAAHALLGPTIAKLTLRHTLKIAAISGAAGAVVNTAVGAVTPTENAAPNVVVIRDAQPERAQAPVISITQPALAPQQEVAYAPQQEAAPSTNFQDRLRAQRMAQALAAQQNTVG